MDTIFGVLGRGHAIVYPPAFESTALQRIREVYPSIIPLTDEEQQRIAGANLLCLDADTVISIAKNYTVNKKLIDHGYGVITVPFSEVIKSGGSVRCDTLPIERL